MELIFDSTFIDDELKDYLLTQNGIKNVEIEATDDKTKLNIEYDSKITPKIVLKYIDLFLEYTFVYLSGFDKKQDIKTKTFEYIVDSICCEYCHNDLMVKLFNNNDIISITSDFFESDKCKKNIKLIVNYNENCTKEKIIEYIKENL